MVNIFRNTLIIHIEKVVDMGYNFGVQGTKGYKHEISQKNKVVCKLVETARIICHNKLV